MNTFYRLLLGLVSFAVITAFSTQVSHAEISSMYVYLDSCNEYIFMSNSANGKVRVLHHFICGGGCWEDSGWVDPIMVEDPPLYFPDNVEVDGEGNYVISVGVGRGGVFNAGTGPSCRGYSENSGATALLPQTLTGYGLE